MAIGIDSSAAVVVKPKPPFSASKNSPYLRRLSEEIDVLRKEMEQTYERGASLQSEQLLVMSQRLDLKINEFLYYKLH